MAVVFQRRGIHVSVLLDVFKCLNPVSGEQQEHRFDAIYDMFKPRSSAESPPLAKSGAAVGS